MLHPLIAKGDTLIGLHFHIMCDLQCLVTVYLTSMLIMASNTNCDVHIISSPHSHIISPPHSPTHLPHHDEFWKVWIHEPSQWAC